MIFTESTIKISNNVSKMDSTIVLYRGDKNIEIRFTILQSPFKYSNTVATNVIESTNASYGQLVIKTPNDKPPIFSEVSATKEGTVLFTITKEMIDEIEELGNYTFQIRLLDENKQSRVTIPPVENGIEIKEPIAIEDDNTTNVVGLAKANYAVATLSDVDTPTFDDNGKYNKTNWNDGDIITNTLLNKIEDGIYTTNENVTTTKKYVDDGINYDKKQFNNKIEAMNMSKHPVSCSTEIYKKPLCDIFPELLNITYNTVFRDYNSFKVNMDNFAKEYPTVKSAYNKLNINLYDENDNSIGNSYGNSINGEGLNIIFINITESLRFYAYFDKALVDGSSTTMETKNGYMTIQLLIPKGNNKQEFIDKIKNLKLTLSVFRTDFLNLNNETMYTPTTDYNPATKKYVDDNMTTAINGVKGDLGTEELTTVAKDLKGAVNELNTQYKEKANVLQHIEKNLDLYPYTEQNGYLYVTVEKNTMIYMDETNFHSITTNKISCNPGDVFLYKGTGRGNAASWVFFKNDLIVNTGQHQGTIEVTIPQDVNYVIFSSFADIRKDVIFSVRYLNDKTFNSKLNTKFTNIVSTINNINVCDYPNLFDKTKVIKGYIGPSGEFTTSDSYYTSDYIFFEKGKTYTLSPNVRIIAYYDAYKYFIKTDENAKLSPYTFTVEDDCYLRFCVYANKLDTFMVEEGETNTSYKPYAPILKNDVGFNTSHKEYINSLVNSSNGNVLFGKKLVACGDSFTEGDFTGYTDENGLSGKNSPIIYDKVRGMYKTYPWWIAERNNMILVNEAKCGTTMTYIPEYTNAFSETRYKNLPKDADYILIKFGINDETGHKNAPLGTIDDTTNATFYGAWNVILEYLITNHPWAKIGIIVTNGTSEKYANAIRESAKKWGIPYLDEANGENVPLLNRTNKSYVCKKAKDLRDAQMKVGETNGHPNIKAHEYESTIVENFLRSL